MLTSPITMSRLGSPCHKKGYVSVKKWRNIAQPFVTNNTLYGQSVKHRFCLLNGKHFYFFLVSYQQEDPFSSFGEDILCRETVLVLDNCHLRHNELLILYPVNTRTELATVTCATNQLAPIRMSPVILLHATMLRDFSTHFPCLDTLFRTEFFHVFFITAYLEPMTPCAKILGPVIHVTLPLSKPPASYNLTQQGPIQVQLNAERYNEGVQHTAVTDSAVFPPSCYSVAN